MVYPQPVTTVETENSVEFGVIDRMIKIMFESNQHAILLGKRPHQTRSFSRILETEKLNSCTLFQRTPSGLVSNSYVSNLN